MLDEIGEGSELRFWVNVNETAHSGHVSEEVHVPVKKMIEKANKQQGEQGIKLVLNGKIQK